jgi:hypothetical protein
MTESPTAMEEAATATQPMDRNPNVTVANSNASKAP